MNPEVEAIKRASKWATRFIREKIDTENKCVLDALYELQGSDLHTALVSAFMMGWGIRDNTESVKSQGRRAAE